MIYTDFAAWKSISERILEDFGFDRTQKRVLEKPVPVSENASGLRNELSKLNLSAFTIVAAERAIELI
ncbi:hypothetical protein ACSAZL_10030 [Methanosarcina sp. T3]|uniref:hypothetical protein n=1 Tax=Methanosarcina sp. T3 TaxID=3439062 RepID=UPI003F872830